MQDHRIRILHWMIPTSCLVVSGIALDLFGNHYLLTLFSINFFSIKLINISSCYNVGMHVNKVLYSFSYTCLTAGAAGILFAGIYLMVSNNSSALDLFEIG